MSPRPLERRFRAETGDSVAGWIARRRVERAGVLLEDPDLTVAQVAHAAGFGSTEALRRHFLTHTGTSPRAYRDTFRGSSATVPRPTHSGTPASG
jgi:transcriptional regulator GlxA family with amidase domain